MPQQGYENRNTYLKQDIYRWDYEIETVQKIIPDKRFQYLVISSDNSWPSNYGDEVYRSCFQFKRIHAEIKGLKTWPMNPVNHSHREFGDFGKFGADRWTEVDIPKVE